MPRFSIIIPHYDGSITDTVLKRGLECLQDQVTDYLRPYRDFEVLLYHDGPESRDPIDLSVYSFPIFYKATKKRYNNWGHSLRDLGIKEARGQYIVHYNPDNVLYDNALYEIEKKIDGECVLNTENNIIIFPIYLNGVVINGRLVARTFNCKDKALFTGYPSIKYNIDCMQLVMRRDTWLSEGGWKDKSEQSDGNMYPYFVAKYGARYIPEVLGEHN